LLLARSVCFILVHGDISSMFPSLIFENSYFSSCYGEYAICWCFTDVDLFEERDRENSFIVLLIFIRTGANLGSKKFCYPLNTSADIGVGSFCCSVRNFLRTDCGRLRVPLYVTPQHGCFYYCVEYRGDSCCSAFVFVPQVRSAIGLKRNRRKMKTLVVKILRRHFEQSIVIELYLSILPHHQTTLVVKILRRHFEQSIVIELYLSILPHHQTTRLLFGFTLLPC
jgi:hypothetical protein